MKKIRKWHAFSATGLVLGNCWGGGKGAYTARQIHANTREDLLDQANKMLADGSLDSGMGFESLIGAALYIKATEYITVDGNTYSRDMNDPGAYIGELTEEEQQELERFWQDSVPF